MPTLSYDNNGNLASYGAWAYTYDYRNRMTSAGNGTATTTYLYDHTGQRVAKGTIGQATTTYPNKYYTTRSASTTLHIYRPDGTLTGTVEGDGSSTTTYSVHPDHLGGTNVITDDTGDLVQTLDYNPFGSVRVDDRDGVFDATRQFIGEEFDDEAALSYLNARYYDGTRGQFLSQDPSFLELNNLKTQLADPQSWNSYSYARANPISLKDPSGEFWWYGFYDWSGYEGARGVAMKAGELFGGHNRAMRSIQRYGSELDQRSSELGVDPELARAITAEEQSHLTPDERLGREQLFPGIGGGGVGLMQVSGPVGSEFGGYTKRELAWNTSKNIYSGVSYINNISATLNTNNPATIGTAYNGSTAYGQRIQARVNNPNYDKDIVLDQLHKAVRALASLVKSLIESVADSNAE